jgi:3-hydroxyacyl-CoA dehydrogenase/enoyl-CoA hydratase/3-hydroxybutyryl-CoA epimerase/3-hydroxyacyl-CoA dehydrogenase/enoyl-CoA hydratase/3-hydroxybutyryl-CoA epimerase/enoyl-CoA isomerase
MFLPMLVEATRVLEAKLVRNVRDVDLGLVFGIGFPPFKGGLLFWADTLGAEKIVEMLKPYEEIGPRYQPTEMLLEMARTGSKFYDAGENL